MPNSKLTSDDSDDLTMAYMRGCSDARTEMLRRIVKMNRAMQDLLESPKGVVPKSAEQFYDYRNGIFK